MISPLRAAIALSVYLLGAPLAAAWAADRLEALGAAPALGQYQISWNLDALRRLSGGAVPAGQSAYGLERGRFLNDDRIALSFGAGGWPAFALDAHIAGPLLATPVALKALGPLPQALRIEPRGAGHDFSLRDAAGLEWLSASHAQPSFDPLSAQLWIRNMDLRVGPALAAAIKQPTLEGQLLGGMAMSVIGAGSEPNVQANSCASPQYQPRWPTLGFRADVALTQIGSVQTLRCETCTNSSTDGLLAMAPSARLRNVGEADIPWAPKFINPNLPPYGGDQHPFLSWNFYRLDANGALKQIGASGFKHAFVSTSLNCPCPSGFILFGGCEDVYGAFTNDIYDILSPRTELIPFRGLWARCGSVFDPDCDGLQNIPSGAPDDYTWRANFTESQLHGVGARYFADAWYVVRDDADIDNGMGVVEVSPVKTGATWTFPQIGNFSAGSILERLQSTLAPAATRLYARQQTGEGRVDTLSVVRAVPGGFHYSVYVANLEWMRTRTEGAFPNLRLLETAGIQRVRVRTPAATLNAPQSFDADALASNDWLQSPLAQGVEFAALAGDLGQLWGTVYRFEWTSSSAPLIGWIEASAGRGALERTVLLTTLLPGGNGLDRIKQSGFDE